MAVSDLVTLGVARQWLRDRTPEGEHCPCCGQYAKVYRRRVNTGMARKLIAAHRLHGTEPFYLPTLIAQLGIPGRDESALHYFGLITETSGRREDGGRAGWWRVTDVGAGYIADARRIPKYALIYDGRTLGFDGPMVGIRDALGVGFDYSELMAA